MSTDTINGVVGRPYPDAQSLQLDTPNLVGETPLSNYFLAKRLIIGQEVEVGFANRQDRLQLGRFSRFLGNDLMIDSIITQTHGYLHSSLRSNPMVI